MSTVLRLIWEILHGRERIRAVVRGWRGFETIDDHTKSNEGRVGFELLLVAGAGLKSRRRRRTREKDRIYHIVNTKEDKRLLGMLTTSVSAVIANWARARR